jgi:hypothetical protein
VHRKTRKPALAAGPPAGYRGGYRARRASRLRRRTGLEDEAARRRPCLAGSSGERLASDYLAGALQKIGAKPLPGKTDVRVPFEFTAGTRDGGSSIAIRGGGAPAPDGQPIVRALSFSDNGDVEAPIVFAGYGIVVPDGQGFPYDSYATLDVKDKIVLVLRYFPEEAEQKTKQVLSRYADLRYKAMAARQHGAKGLIVVTGPR